jgi:hypothetical protein
MRPGRLFFVKPWSARVRGGSTLISGGLGRLLIGGLLDRRGQLLSVRSPGQYHVAVIERVAGRRSIRPAGALPMSSLTACAAA